MTTALAKTSDMTGLIPSNLAEAEALASSLAKSSMLPEHFKGKVSDVFWAVALGMEVGLPPVATLSGVYTVHGKPGFYADTMVALVISKPHICRYFRRVSSDDTEATYETHRVGAPEPVRLQVTLAYAERAGWVAQNAKYKSEPRRMLEARAKSWLAKDTYQDVLRGISSVEELRDEGAGFVAPAIPFRAPASVERAAIEATATEQPPALAPVGPTVDELVARMGGAKSVEELTTIGAGAKGRTGDERKTLLDAYKAKLSELTAAAGAA